MSETFITIDSDYQISDCDTHFRVKAGPGAGKTHWLINHIKNTLKNSKKFNSTSRIACITYTNVAVDEIKDRLGFNVEQVEVSTIHGFLYKNLIKPYAHLFKCKNLDSEKIDGHEEHKPRKDITRKWLLTLKKQYESASKFLKIFDHDTECSALTCKYLAKMHWSHTGDGFKLILDNNYRPKYFPSSTLENFIEYKKLYWEEGIIHHDDVLYFSFLILEQCPLLRKFIASRFTHIFIDEFQDTNHIQTQIIKWLADKGAIIGIIGDPAQSIYSFNGAQPEDFEDFILDPQIDYQIDGNRRSNNAIISLLNQIRTDLQQKTVRIVKEKDVHLIVGDLDKNIPKFFEFIKIDMLKNNYCILARKNKNVADIKKIINSHKNLLQSQEDIWMRFFNIDPGRSRIFNAILESLKLANQKLFQKAINKLATVIKSLDKKKNSNRPEIEKRIIIIKILKSLLSNYDIIITEKLMYLYDLVNSVIEKYNLSIASFKKGAPQDFFNNTPCADLYFNIKSLEENLSEARTVHQAKGTEFDSVLLCLQNESDINRIIQPDTGNEECRIYYVAMSRARENLFISVPSIQKKKVEDEINKLGIKIIRT